MRYPQDSPLSLILLCCPQTLQTYSNYKVNTAGCMLRHMYKMTSWNPQMCQDHKNLDALDVISFQIEGNQRDMTIQCNATFCVRIESGVKDSARTTNKIKF